MAQRTYDLVVIGGGIFGVCAAWDATLRGLSVALLERGDFSHATSANSYKIVHGGIRYVQQADLALVRESSHERTVLLRVAPHLVHPLPIVVPTYGYGMKGKPILRMGFLIYDLLTLDRNRGIDDRQRKIPFGRFLSREELLGHFSCVPREGLTGGAIMCDAQMYNPPRLALSFLRSAVEAGAEAANYAQVEGFLRDGPRVTGVEATDLISGRVFEVRGRMVLNAAGPWAGGLLERALDLRLEQRPSFSRDVGLVIGRRPISHYGLAGSAASTDAEALIDRGGRHLFLLPWRDHTLVGVWHKVYSGPADESAVTDEEIVGFVDEANQAFPGVEIRPHEVTAVNTGLILFGDEKQETSSHKFAKRSLLIDHEKQHGIGGLLTLIGVRATTARSMAEKAVALIADQLDRSRVPSRTAHRPIFGGNLGSVESLRREVQERVAGGLDETAVNSLVRNYGSEYGRVLSYVNEDPARAQPLGSSHVLSAEVIHAVREEMAVTVQDVVLRRTDLGTAADPGRDCIEQCARLIAGELDWDEQRVRDEIASAEAFFTHRGSRKDFRMAVRI
jgi:glycerol-3-phosphate dehydrogenase